MTSRLLLIFISLISFVIFNNYDALRELKSRYNNVKRLFYPLTGILGFLILALILEGLFKIPSNIMAIFDGVFTGALLSFFTA